jgi:hypothetical protein
MTTWDEASGRAAAPKAELPDEMPDEATADRPARPDSDDGETDTEGGLAPGRTGSSLPESERDDAD